MPTILLFFGSLIMLFVLDWKMTLLTCITIPVFVLIMIPLGNITQKISKSTQSKRADFSGLLGRVLTEMKLVKVSNTEKLELDNACHNLNEVYGYGLKQAKITGVIQPISGLIMLIAVGTILGFGGIRVSSEAMSAGTLVAMIFYVLQFSVPLLNLSSLITDYKRAVGASSRVFEILHENFYSVFRDSQQRSIIYTIDRW